MWVDNLGLLLQVEGILVILHISLCEFAWIVLTIVGEESLRVRVTHKTVDAARVS